MSLHFILLIATLLALMSGPLLYLLARNRPPLHALLDGFVLVSITGLVLLDALPSALAAGGVWSLAFLLAGLLGPTLLEHLLTRARREAHLAALALAVSGLIIHSLADGAALAPGAQAQDSLALAVAVHSLPVGLVVWWLMAPVFGALLPSLALAAMTLGTLAGFHYGIELGGLIGPQAGAWFQALVAGSILHVVFGRPHLDEDSEHHRGPAPWEGLGNLAALLALFGLGTLHAASPAQAAFLERLLDLALESAPALLIAYLIGGFIAGELPQSWLRWIGRGGTLAQAARGMAVGLPLPICSCGVLPVYRSLVQRGVPQAAGLAFLIATPEVGLTALLVSFPLLGLEYTLLRVASAAVLAIFVAWILTRLLPSAPTMVAPAPACCAHEHGHAHAPAATGGRIPRALRAGLVELVDGTAPWIVAGLLIAALAMPYLHTVMWNQLPDALEILAFAALGLPLYVCAAGATPLVAVLIAAGVSPGAAIAFLLTGPATNIATFGVLSTLHGRRLALAFGGVTALGAVLVGLLVNQVAPDTLPPVAALHQHAPSLWQQLSLLALLLLFTASLLRLGGRAFIGGLQDGSRA